MKKNVSTPVLRMLSLVILTLFLSSFIIHTSTASETVNTFDSTTEHKHNVLKTTVLTLGLLGGAVFMRRRFKRHFHRHPALGGGCLGVLGIIGLVILGLILLPLILVALIFVGIAALFGVRVRRPRRRYRRFD